MESSKIGASIISREAAEKRRQHFFKQKSYWQQLEKKKGNHQYVKSALLNMNELSGEFLIMPRLLEQFFFLYLNKHRPSQQNSQLALSVVRVFALLAHQYYKSAAIFKMVSSFYVSPSVWDKWLIGRKAKESGIAILKEMGVITSYRFNRNKFAPPDNLRFVTMYQFNLDKVKWLQGCVKTMATFEELKQEEKIESNRFDYVFDDIANDIFGFIEQAEGS